MSHASRFWLWHFLCLGALLCAALAWAEEDIRFLDCRPWQGTCPEMALDEPVSALMPPVPPSPASRAFFPPETLAKDTPPLFVELLNNPTPENARTWYAWQVERQQIIKQVQALITQVAKEAKERTR